MSERDHQPKRFPSCAETDNYLLELEAELSSMRTALKEIGALVEREPDWYGASMPYQEGYMDARSECAAIAQRALTAGSGNE